MNMKRVKLFEQFLNEAKYTKLDSVGSIIDQNGIVYPEMENGKPDLNAGVEFSELSDEWLSALSKEDKKKISKFESFINEKSSHYISNLVDALSNPDALEGDPQDWADFCKELGLEERDAMKIFDEYWTLGAKDRFHFSEKEWTKWLSKLGIK